MRAHPGYGRQFHYEVLLEHGQIQRVYLDELTAVEGGGWQRALLRLTVAPEEQAPELACRLIEQAQGTVSPIGRLQILDLVEMILVYKLPRLTRGEIRQMLHLPDIDLQETNLSSALPVSHWQPHGLRI